MMGSSVYVYSTSLDSARLSSTGVIPAYIPSRVSIVLPPTSIWYCEIVKFSPFWWTYNAVSLYFFHEIEVGKMLLMIASCGIIGDFYIFYAFKAFPYSIYTYLFSYHFIALISLYRKLLARIICTHHTKFFSWAQFIQDFALTTLPQLLTCRLPVVIS